MEAQALTTEARQGTGKGAARQLRAAGMIPAVYYTRGSEPVSLAVSPKELTAALSTSHRRNRLFTITVNGESKPVIVQDLQVHPVTRDLLHVDFLGVDPTNPIERAVPLKTKGRAAGVVSGGDLRVLFRSLPVRCTPDAFPADITLDVTKLQQGESIKVADVKLPEGVTIQMPAERNVVTIAASRRRGAKGEAEAEA